ncbi:MAG: ATPase [Sarcina sp.]
MRQEELENFDTIEMLELVYEMIDRGTKVPISGKVMVDKHEILEKIDEIRHMYPQEVTKAKWIVDKKDEMLREADIRLSTAKRESMDIIESQVKNHDIVRDAQKRAQVIKEQAKEEARQIRVYAREYADDLLKELQGQIEFMTKNLLEKMKGDVEDFAEKLTMDMKEAIETIDENAKELQVPLD